MEWTGWHTGEWNIEGNLLLRLKLHVYDAMFMTLGCSVTMEHAVFKIKYNQDYSTKLFEISIVGKIYDFESYHMLNLIF